MIDSLIRRSFSFMNESSARDFGEHSNERRPTVNVNVGQMNANENGNESKNERVRFNEQRTNENKQILNLFINVIA